MSDATARFALPLIAPGQAQKELFHNEALARIDALLQAAVVAVSVDDPPVAPVAGQCWIVGDAPTGAWAGQPRSLAVWTEGGWRMIAPAAGMIAWSAADGVFARFDGVAWSRGDLVARRLLVGGVPVVGVQQPQISAPSGGATVDAEARSALAEILAALRAHGLIAA